MNKEKIPLFDPISQNFNVPLFGLTTVHQILDTFSGVHENFS